jgi:hypothetical protein
MCPVSRLQLIKNELLVDAWTVDPSVAGKSLEVQCINGHMTVSLPGHISDVCLKSCSMKQTLSDRRAITRQSRRGRHKTDRQQRYELSTRRVFGRSVGDRRQAGRRSGSDQGLVGVRRLHTSSPFCRRAFGQISNWKPRNSKDDDQLAAGHKI